MQKIIEVTNLSKKYLIYHEQTAYSTLVDTLSRKARSLWNKMTSPLTSSKAPSCQIEEFWALKDINLEIEEGDRIGIIGRNGAGKSTLLKLLSRITGPTTGSIKVRGRVASLLEVGTGFHPELTGRENVFLNGSILGMKNQEIKKKFDEIVAFAEIEKFLDTPVKRFSSGMITRLGFAIAAHLDPDLLIVDEVLAVGDASFQEKCLKKLSTLGSSGRTVIFVSHDVGAVLTLCNKGIYLEKGRLVEYGPIDRCINHYMKHCKQRAMSWEGDQGDEHIRFYKATLHSKTPEREFFYQSEKATLEIEYEILIPTQDLIIGIGIWNQRSQLMAHSHSCDDVENIGRYTKAGRHRVFFSLDAGMFHEGEYLIKLESFIHNKKQINTDDIVLKYPVYSLKKDTRFGYIREKNGVFLGNHWQHEPLSKALN